MKGIKDLLSVKATDRRLPPLRSTSRSAVITPPVAHISIPLPAIPSAQDFASYELGHMPANNVNENKTEHSDATFRLFSADDESAAQSAAASGLQQPTHNNAIVETANQSASPSDMFNAMDSSTAAVNAVNQAQKAREEAEKKLQLQGIRTWPVLSVISVFCCNPLTGMLAALLTLSAENSFYKGYVFQAQLEARMAKVFLILSIFSGFWVALGMIIWVAVNCAGEQGCP